MSVKSMPRKSPPPSRTDRKRLNGMRDEDIDYSDVPETSPEFWADAEVFMPKKKVPVTLRLDEDIVKTFKREGPGYQSRINAVLRAYVVNKATVGKARVRSSSRVVKAKGGRFEG